MTFSKTLSLLRNGLKKRMLMHHRELFYSEILDRFYSPADTASIKFGQGPLLEGARVESKILENQSGILHMEIGTEYSGIKGQHAYSLHLAGDLFRISLLLYGGLEKAPLVDWKNEIQTIWPGCAPDQQDRDGLTMYHWTFILPDIYSNYATQERYILGMHHMHCRVLRIVRDYRMIQQMENEIALPE